MSIRSRRVCHEDPRIYSGPPLDPLAARYSSREPGLAETKPSTWCVRTSPARGGMTSSQGPSPVAIGVASAAPLRSPHLGAVTAPAPGERAGSKDVSLCAAATRSAVHLDEVQRSRCRPRPASTTAARSLPRRTGRAAAGLISRSSSIGQDLRGDLPWLPGLVALFGQGRPGSDLWSAELTVSIFAL